jgi:carbonic anhydrase
VKTSIKNLRTFPFVREAEEGGKLELHGAHFDIKTGTLCVLDRSTDKFGAL